MNTGRQRPYTFSNPSVCEAVANFWKMTFFLDEIILSEGRLRGIIFFFKRHTEEAVLLNFKWLRQQAQAYGKSATGAGRIIGPLSGGSARTRDQSDLRKRHFHFGRRNTTAEMAATRMLPPCRLSAAFWAVRLRQYFFPHKDISPQPPLVESIEHLKKRDNCNVE